jgi:hypothetical protein
MFERKKDARRDGIRKIHNEELHNLYLTSDIIKMK